MTRRLIEAAKILDARSSRSKQRKVGASEIGVCRRRAGYTHHGVPPTNPENVTGWAAVAGTWYHKGALDTMRREWGSIIETRVEDDIIRGHVDAIELPNDWRIRAGLDPHEEAPDVVEVDDLKTRRDRRALDIVRNRGPKRSELFQVHIYADLLRRGKIKPIQRQKHLADLGPLPVDVIRLRYLARSAEEGNDGADGEYVYDMPFSRDIAVEAWDYVEQVTRSKRPEDLPRDQDGPGLSIVCDNCPFKQACWGHTGDYAPQSLLVVTDADLAAAMAEYDEARTTARDATERKDKHRKMLDATRPAIYTDGEQAWKLHWTGGNARDPVPDVDAMLRLFNEAGIEVPLREVGPSPRTLHLTRWEVPEPPCGKPVGDPPTEVFDADPFHMWRQDRPRGGWTRLNADSTEEEAVTAGQFAKRFPGYTEPRPPCILKKGHSGLCWPSDAVTALDVPDHPPTAPEALQ